MMIWIFWLSVAFIVYSFVGYPAALWVLGFRRGRPPKRASIWPNVSIIIACHNAANSIRDKLRNTLELDYDPAKLEIIVVSDGSADQTGDIAREFARKNVTIIELA